ncbi:hypothetical protein HUF18_07495 [Thalassolituus sp. ST750PaO-4]|uniref:hypothetical protein n=1 Tax=Thalassolituus sp. ST750PaO-4 TaxID=2742965 RepID=UPI001CE2B104|nr:hypothetical protein [Thalassolituus sp. ST750PaO-4]MCA6059620.1 hypothetical protein [Thalassolituus sp. ST750PaO-4]
MLTPESSTENNKFPAGLMVEMAKRWKNEKRRTLDAEAPESGKMRGLKMCRLDMNSISDYNAEFKMNPTFELARPKPRLDRT